MRAKLVLAFILTTVAAGGTIVACSLGLDESLIPGSDASVGDGGSDSALDATPNPTTCKVDTDCKSSNACLHGACETDAGQCVYTICPANACSVSVCGTGNQCSAPTTYEFHAGAFHVSLGNIGCGGAQRHCFAAVYPFVFVGTTNGVVAYPVEDPTNSSPSSIPVAGLPFFPNFIVSNGNIVYFVGTVVGTGPSYKVPIASLTVPTDPTVSEMVATTVFDSLTVASVDAVYPDTSNGIYLVHNDAPTFYPAARIAAPLKDLDSLSFQATAGLPANSAVAAASGTRLVTFRQENAYPGDTFFSLETAAATTSAQNAGEQSTIPTIGQTSGPFYLAQSPSGGLLWSTPSVTISDAGASQTVSARIAWVLADQNATNFDGTTHVDVATYNVVGLGADLPGPPAWIDDNTALVTAAVPTSTGQTAVAVATRNGTPQLVPDRTFTLAFPPSKLAVAASNGFGYVLVPGNPSGADVHVFGTTCNSQ